MRIKTLGWVFTLLTLGAQSAIAAPDLSKTTLSVASTGWKVEQAVLKLAKLDDTPYRVTYQTFQGGALGLEAMAANKVDFAVTSEIPPVFASLAANKGNFKIIAIQNSTTLHQELIVPPNSPIKSVADLKGKRVGYIKSTTAHYFLYQMLKSAGLKWDDIKRVEITTADGVTALFGGGIDAFASYGNSIRAAELRGAHQLASAENILSGNFPIVASQISLQDPGKRAAFADYIGRLNAAYYYAQTHPEAWAKVSADPTGRPYDVALADTKAEFAQRPTRDTTVSPEARKTQQDVADTLYATGLLEKPVDVATFYDTSLTDGINQSLASHLPK
ncbi:ABC transporter substrate-binding protein [Candidatus Pantoea multigeneris]|uniref:PhnD/SsuA/transferrin family substrate-binding protein n=1 Tax=Candidatus Pantoea multigeneris TaxID=2608357 RepID=A0ABX0RE44_9GAMM|nr:ABC transporter substrate-binding protein [Pantoea multigeneris]NIF23630.1 PhnD/SsuA/transferrin family substrate-binding protein [Pantoea multigeneris]